MIRNSKKTPIEVCPVEWARIKDAIKTSFKENGLTALYVVRAIDGIAALLYDARGSATYGRKWLEGEKVVRVSSAHFEKMFKKTSVARKAKKVLLDAGIIAQDESWSNFDDKEKWAQGYIVKYEPKTPPEKWIKVWFPSSVSILETALVRLRTITNEFRWNEDQSVVLHIDKKALTDDVRAGLIDVDDFSQFVGAVRKYPDLKSCKSIGEDGDNRVYTPLTMVAKNLLKYFHDDAGNRLMEFTDIHSSFAITLPFAITAEHPVFDFGGKLQDINGFTDLSWKSIVDSLYGERVLKIDGRLIENPGSDLYGKIVRFIESEEPDTNLFYGCRTAKEKRDLVKKENQRVLFAQEKEIKRWNTLKKNAIEEMKKGIKVTRGKLYYERRARMDLAILKFYEKGSGDFRFGSFWKVIRALADGETGKHTPAYQMMTRGEAVVMKYLEARLKKDYGFSDIAFYRKHDALLSCVPEGRLPDDWELKADYLVGRILSDLVADSRPTTNNIVRLYNLALDKGIIQ